MQSKLIVKKHTKKTTFVVFFLQYPSSFCWFFKAAQTEIPETGLTEASLNWVTSGTGDQELVFFLRLGHLPGADRR